MVGLFARLAVLGILAVVVLMSGALVFGRAFAPPPSVMATSGCVLPCAFGVTPGQTEREMAQITYEQISLEPSSFLTGSRRSFTLQTSIAPEARTMAIVDFQQPSGGDVRSVRLYSLPSSVALWRAGDLIAVKGRPERVYAACYGTPNLYLLFEDGTIAEAAPGARLLPSTPLNSIAVTADLRRTLPPLLRSLPCVQVGPWHGFGPSWQYAEG